MKPANDTVLGLSLAELENKLALLTDAEVRDCFLAVDRASGTAVTDLLCGELEQRGIDF